MFDALLPLETVFWSTFRRRGLRLSEMLQGGLGLLAISHEQQDWDSGRPKWTLYTNLEFCVECWLDNVSTYIDLKKTFKLLLVNQTKRRRCFVWRASRGVLREVCFARCASRGVLREVYFAWCASRGVLRMVCFARCASRGVLREVCFARCAIF